MSKDLKEEEPKKEKKVETKNTTLKNDNKKKKNNVEDEKTTEISEKKQTKKSSKKNITEVKEKEKKELTVKKNPKDILVNQEQLEKIEEEIKKQKTIPEERQKKMNKKIFKNIMIAIVVILYLIFINLGFYNIDENTYLTDLKVFSIITIGITIILFEKAYRKDSGEITIYGIETLVLSICTFMATFINIQYKAKYPYIINLIALLFGVYYIGKTIVIYIKLRKNPLYRETDIHKIVKK